MNQTPLALHYGLTSTRDDQHPTLNGSASSNPRAVLLPPLYGVSVSGTWERWGEADEDPAQSLHVVVTTYARPLTLADFAARTRDLLRTRTGPHTRLLEHAVVTTLADWSETVGFITFDHATAYYTAVQQPPPPPLSDRAALDTIAHLLSAPSWDSGFLETIADTIGQTERPHPGDATRREYRRAFQEATGRKLPK